MCEACGTKKARAAMTASRTRYSHEKLESLIRKLPSVRVAGKSRCFLQAPLATHGSSREVRGRRWFDSQPPQTLDGQPSRRIYPIDSRRMVLEATAASDFVANASLNMQCFSCVSCSVFSHISRTAGDSMRCGYMVEMLL